VEGLVEPVEHRDDRGPVAVLDHARAAEVAEFGARDAHGDLELAAAALEGLRALRPRLGEVEVLRAAALLGELAGGDDSRDAVHALLAAPPREQVPDAGLEDEAERVQAARHDGRALAVAHVDAPSAPESAGDHRQVRHAVLLAEPAAHVDVEELRRAARALLELLRQGGEELQARRSELAAEAELGGGPDEERLRLDRVEAGQLRAVAALEAIAAGRPAHGDDRHSRGGQRLCISLHRPLRDL
jgi:hypothetical protein